MPLLNSETVKSRKLKRRGNLSSVCVSLPLHGTPLHLRQSNQPIKYEVLTFLLSGVILLLIDQTLGREDSSQ